MLFRKQKTLRNKQTNTKRNDQKDKHAGSMGARQTAPGECELLVAPTADMWKKKSLRTWTEFITVQIGDNAEFVQEITTVA